MKQVALTGNVIVSCWAIICLRVAIKYNENLEQCYKENIEHQGEMTCAYTDLYHILSRNILEAGIVDMPSSQNELEDT